MHTSTYAIDPANAVTQYADVVGSIAHTVCKTPPPGFEQADLVQNGQLGLLKACRDYQAERKIPFIHYAAIKIKGAILDGLYANASLSKPRIQTIKRILRTEQTMRYQSGIKPTPTSVCKTLGITRKQYDQAKKDQPLLSVTACDQDIPSNDQLFIQRHDLQVAISQLTAKEQTVIIDYYFFGFKHRDIALKLNTHAAYVSAIKSRALKKMKKDLSAAGSRSSNTPPLKTQHASSQQQDKPFVSKLEQRIRNGAFRASRF
ncbi:MAG TPA: sigma-70 family RNA polymerase sigma factor [Crenotrichaceae bacterium]|nr:sigma-70 family RNA polymerase sigma factor [Crenotrichaceae bacterium]